MDEHFKAVWKGFPEEHQRDKGITATAYNAWCAGCNFRDDVVTENLMLLLEYIDPVTLKRIIRGFMLRSWQPTPKEE